jgi:hypothetical protein
MDGRPSQLVIVRGRLWLARGRLHGRSHGIQQLIELNFADRTLRVRGDNTHRNHPQNIDAPLLALIASFSSLQEVEKPELSRSSYGPEAGRPGFGARYR